MTGRSRLLLLLLMVMVAGAGIGCSSDDPNDLGLPTTPSPAESTAVTAEVVEPTTTATTPDTPPTTSAAATTVVASTAVETTQPAPTTIAEPTTTTIDTEAQKAQVEADFLAAFEVRAECGRNPAACDFAAFAEPGSPMDTLVRETMQVRLDSNLRALPGVGQFIIRVEKVIVDGETAMVASCALDDVVLFDVGSSPTPEDDIVFDDSTVSTLSTWEMHLINGRWTLFSGTNDLISEENLCRS